MNRPLSAGLAIAEPLKTPRKSASGEESKSDELFLPGSFGQLFGGPQNERTFHSEPTTSPILWCSRHGYNMLNDWSGCKWFIYEIFSSYLGPIYSMLKSAVHIYVQPPSVLGQ
jgi:hypothetical protein